MVALEGRLRQSESVRSSDARGYSNWVRCACGYGNWVWTLCNCGGLQNVASFKAMLIKQSPSCPHRWNLTLLWVEGDFER